MNKINLINLGAIAQKQFNMKDNFQLMEVASDHFGKVRVAIPSSISNISSPFATPLEFDDVELTQFGTSNNHEFVWCGYSVRANVLVIKEVASPRTLDASPTYVPKPCFICGQMVCNH